MSTPLAYAPKDPRRARRRFWRRLILWPLVFGALAFSLFWCWNRLPLLYWQHKCQTYIAPPHQIIMSSFPEDIERLKADPNYSIVTETWSRYVVRKAPDCVLRYPGLQGGVFSRCAPTFLHRLIGADGKAVLVAVAARETGYDSVSLSPERLFGVGQDSTVTVTTVTGRSAILIEGASGTRLAYYRVFAGQPDSADPSHFTIQMDFETDLNHIVDGYLVGNSVVLKDRKPR